MKIQVLIFGALTGAALMLAAPALAHDQSGGDHVHHDGKAVFGLWQVEDGTAVVRIADCGDGTPCGTLHRIDVADPAAVLDSNNPDPELAQKPLLGSRMLWGFEAKSDKWSGGRIYDPESGQDYKSKIEKRDDGTLKVKGCLGPFCQSQIWAPVTPES